MEILERGKLPEEQQADFNCNSCKSKLRAFKKEGKIHYCQRDGNYVLFKCPVCLRDIYVALECFK